MVNGIHYDHGKKSLFQGLVEGLEKTFAETWFQALIVLILLNFPLHSISHKALANYGHGYNYLMLADSHLHVYPNSNI